MLFECFKRLQEDFKNDLRMLEECLKNALRMLQERSKNPEDLSQNNDEDWQARTKKYEH